MSKLISNAVRLTHGFASNVRSRKARCLQLELKFLTWVTQFLADISGPSQTPTRELRDQLDRASLSALLNTAEGNGRRQGRQRAKSFDDARGSAIECAACLDASVAKGFAVLERIQTGKEMLVRIVAMLTKLVERFDPDQYRVRENASGVAQSLRGRGRRRARGRVRIRAPFQT